MTCDASLESTMRERAPGHEHLASRVVVATFVDLGDLDSRSPRMPIGLGMDAAAAQEVALPLNYDPQSGQAWTRRRDLYLVHDMYAQFTILRTSLIAANYP